MTKTMTKTKKTITLAACVALLAFTGCDEDEDPGMDAGGMDAGGTDAGGTDAGGSDAGTDAGGTDAGAPMARGMDNPPTIGAQIDRAGRPAISTAAVGTFMAPGAERDTLKDNYNANDDPSTWAAMYADGIADMIAIYDGIGGTDDTNGCGDQLSDGSVATGDEARYDFLAGVLADDRLILITNSTAGHCDQYLGGEALVLGIVDAATAGCGGRAPTVDVVDRSYSVLVNGSLGDFGDSVDFADIPAADQPNDDTFPFLPAP